LGGTKVFCSACGTQLPDDAGFCSKCGKPEQYVIIAMSKQRLVTTIATITLLGTAAGAFWAMYWTGAHIILMVAAISGFISCLGLSLVFTRIMVRRNWAGGLGLSLLFGSIAGALSGLTTGFAMTYFGFGMEDIDELVFTSAFGAGVGISVGVLLSGLSSSQSVARQ
jgi:hypothetical protein